MVIGQFNGVNIIQLPTAPGPQQIEFAYNNSVSMVRSPYTGFTQVQPWAGGQWWEVNLTLPKLRPYATRASPYGEAAVWNAFLAECYGCTNVFYLGDPLHKSPKGNVAGSSPVANGVQNSMSTTLSTRGWKINTTNVLLPGDLIQLGTFLHRVLSPVSSDGNGMAVLPIWPTLRVATTDGQALTLNDPQGLFRMAENRQSITSNESHLSAVTLRCIEAR